MRHILAIAFILALATSPAYSAEGRNTAAVGGFIVGAVSGFLVRDAMATPAPREKVVYVESAPREVVVIREAPTPPPARIIIVEGRSYVVRPSETVIVYKSEGGWTPPVAHRPHGLD